MYDNNDHRKPYGRKTEMEYISDRETTGSTTATTAMAAAHADKDYAITDVKLFKAIGLYGILRPADSGGFGARHRRALLATTWLAIGYYAVMFAWLATSLHDFQRVTYTAAVSTCGIISTLKGRAVLNHAAGFWTVLDSARAAYTTAGRRSPGTMRRCGRTVSRALRVMVALCYGAMVAWLAMPWLSDARVPVAGADGTVGRYRATVFNAWFPVPEAVHNAWPVWTALYALEAVVCSAAVFSWVAYDCYLVTSCFSFSAQFRTVAAAYEKLGRSRAAPVPSPGGLPDSQTPSDDDVKIDHLNELVSVIQDNQAIIKALDKFYDIVQPLIILQIIIGTFAIIGFTFSTSVIIVSGQSTMTIQFFKLLCAVMSIFMELFICCYGFDIIETEKSALNFGLYSCNWTGMDLKFQKTMLLAMIMNSAHKRKMKATSSFIINLELLFKVVKMAFSVVPVLLNVTSQN